MADPRIKATTDLFVKWLSETNHLTFDKDAKGARRAKHMDIYQPFCLANRTHFKDQYGITWPDGKKPGQAGFLFRNFTDHVLKDGLRAYHAKQLGVSIEDVEETAYNAKHNITSNNGEKGTRGIENWRVNPNSNANPPAPPSPNQANNYVAPANAVPVESVNSAASTVDVASSTNTDNMEGQPEQANESSAPTNTSVQTDQPVDSVDSAGPTADVANTSTNTTEDPVNGMEPNEIADGTAEKPLAKRAYLCSKCRIPKKECCCKLVVKRKGGKRKRVASSSASKKQKH